MILAPLHGAKLWISNNSQLPSACTDLFKTQASPGSSPSPILTAMDPSISL
ncbi:hypothetical protein SYN65AY6A5_07160 [Synechococcus sp. 65AY6A5]|nr:hypothetical protein SYN65AY6A5_07160 [Synechococcus sp. 65AY6A5]